jgi:hypothetical protein
MRFFLFPLLFLCFPCLFIHAQTYTLPEIIRVLVDPVTNNVHVYYTGTDHPDVTHYKISQWVLSGNPFPSGVPIESSRTNHTGAADYHWTDYIEEVVSEPVGFTIGAYNSIDEPINQSYPPDSTIYLEADYDSCSASVSLRWNDYNAWRGNILEYEINGSNTDGSFIVLTRVNEGTNQLVITGLQAYNQYLFFIIARENRLFSDAYVTSNGVRFSTPHAYYPEFIHADFGTVDEGNRPYMNFSVDSLSELLKYRVYRSENETGPFAVIDSVTPVGDRIEYTDETVDASVRPYYYSLSAVNFCNAEITASENIAGTVFLSVQRTGTTVNLTWTPYYEWPAGVSTYGVERRLSEGTFEPLGQTNSTTFTDNSIFNLSGQDVQSEVCYRITAHEAPGDQHSPESASSVSNSVCIRLPMNVRFEYDAIVPGLDGFSEFGPTMDFLPRYYNFKIFNRTGTRVFESTDPNNPAWDGRYENGDLAQEGVYRFQLEYDNENGERMILNGKVSVVSQ